MGSCFGILRSCNNNCYKVSVGTVIDINNTQFGHNFNKLPFEIWERILEDLSPTGVSCLHLTSRHIFKVRSDLLAHQKHKSQHTTSRLIDLAYKRLIDFPNVVDYTPEDVQRRQARRHLKFTVLTLDIEKLTDSEITLLIKWYKNNFEYKFIQRKHTAYGNHIIESFQASYEILRPILKKKDVCYANTIKHLKKLDNYPRVWVKSFDDIHVYDRKEEIQWENTKTIRSYASEFNLRLRTLWL